MDDSLSDDFLLTIPRKSFTTKKKEVPVGRAFVRSSTMSVALPTTKKTSEENGSLSPSSRYVEALTREREERMQERNFWQQQLTEARVTLQAQHQEKQDKMDQTLNSLEVNFKMMLQDMLKQTLQQENHSLLEMQRLVTSLQAEIEASKVEKEVMNDELKRLRSSHQRLEEYLANSEKQCLEQAIAFENEKTRLENLWNAEKEELWSMIARTAEVTPRDGTHPCDEPLSRSHSGTSQGEKLTLELARQQRKKQKNPVLEG
eukprot:PhF_6_TR39888/c0_g1_i1/m.59300